MFCGILLGALAAFALTRFALRRAHHFGYAGCGPSHLSCGGHGFTGGEGRHGHGFGPRGHHGRSGGFGRKAALRWLFERLDTTPGQEKVILEAAEEVQAAWAEARGEWRTSLSDVSKAVRGEEFNHEAVGEAWARHDGLFEKGRLSLVTALQKVHAALDPEQRRRLGELLERGAGFGRFGEWV